MDEILEMLKNLVENPEDMSQLPQAISRLEEMRQQQSDIEGQYQDRISKLQEANRSLLSQIPINTGNPEPDPEDEKVTFEDAQEQFLNAMKNVGGNA